MPFLAHPENAAGLPHLLRDHLTSVGALARRCAALANPLLAESAEWAGKLHDLGKYRDEFQAYLRRERQGSVETHHAVYGAKLAFQHRKLALAFAIAAHHAGLHDAEMLRELLQGTRYDFSGLPELQRRFETEVGTLTLDFADPDFCTDKLRLEMGTRMLFSALVDADFLDTEAHYQMHARQRVALEPDRLLTQLLAEKNAKSTSGALNALRHRIFQQCLDAAEQPPGFFALTVPTGGGKTLSGMAFALRHAQRHGLRRVIVVIPYLSIIEQNAALYRRIFDPDDTGIVVEQHSAVSVPDDAEEKQPRSALEYASDNWDAPIIVTTSVQCIESLFASRPGRCRKLHNMARSVVIFDEVQTLPTHLLNPLLNVLRELQRTYGVSFIFSTATQPAFRHSRAVSAGFAAGELTEITRETAATFQQLQRVRYRCAVPGQTLSWATIAAQMAERPQALCVVNTRRHAFELWNALRRLLPESERHSLFHLSSWMCAQHRFDLLGDDRVLEAATIRALLKRGAPCRVVSTQLIEAGVDVDFPLVYRALAPLDAIVQAAGRCNREGRLTDAAGQPALGDVIIFTPEEPRLPPGVYQTATNITSTLLQQTSEQQLATDPQLFERYFTQLFTHTDPDVKDIQALRADFKFRTVAREARVISDDTRPVIVPYGDSPQIIADIQDKGREQFSRYDLRRLQRYMVNLHTRDFFLLQGLGQIRAFFQHWDMHVLAEGFYDHRFGVMLQQRPEEDFIL